MSVFIFSIQEAIIFYSSSSLFVNEVYRECQPVISVEMRWSIASTVKCVGQIIVQAVVTQMMEFAHTAQTMAKKRTSRKTGKPFSKVNYFIEFLRN